jgi:hypothetical protein
VLNFIFLNSFVINSTCLNVDKAFSNNFLILGKISKTVGGEGDIYERRRSYVRGWPP